MIKFRLYLDKDKEEKWLNEMSDRESKIISYKKIRRLFSIVLVVEVICTLLEVPSMLNGDWFGFGLILVMTIFIARSLYSTNKKIKLLENNKID